MVENRFEEYKRELTSNFEREVVAFLNKSGGDIYLGIEIDGKKIIKVTVAKGVEATYYLKIWINRENTKKTNNKFIKFIYNFLHWYIL